MGCKIDVARRLGGVFEFSSLENSSNLPEPFLLGRGPPKNCKNDLTIKLDGNWSSFQLANSAPPLSVTDSAIAPSARIAIHDLRKIMPSFAYVPCAFCECRRTVVLLRNTLPGARDLLPLRVCCRRLCAMPVQHLGDPEQAQRKLPPEKNCCDKQVSSWRHISCHTDKNRYYT